jgi:flagellar biosynthesis activator protein FlaF
VFANPMQAYQNVNRATMSGREIEASVLTKAALRLKKCLDNWKPDETNEELDESLRYNQKIWTIFQSELLRTDNPLPKELKNDILRLSVFIDKRTLDIMAFPKPEKLKILIDINRNIASGLRGNK